MVFVLLQTSFWIFRMRVKRAAVIEIPQENNKWTSITIRIKARTNLAQESISKVSIKAFRCKWEALGASIFISKILSRELTAITAANRFISKLKIIIYIINISNRTCTSHPTGIAARPTQRSLSEEPNLAILLYFRNMDLLSRASTPHMAQLVIRENRTVFSKILLKIIPLRELFRQ